jgi:hypothetical protein
MNSFNKTLCVQCKTNYGSNEREGMCSVCYKEYKSKQLLIEKTQVTNKDVTMTDNIIDNTNIVESKDDKMIVEEPVVTDVRPKQTNIYTCYRCDKKVGYLGFKCKCDYIFCGTHRHFSDHDCDFDYKTSDREKLLKKNPELAVKVNK